MPRWRSVTSSSSQGSVLALEYWCPSRSLSITETALIKCTLSRFAFDMKLSSVVNSTEGWDAIHRDLDKLEKWAHKKFLGFSNCKYRCCTSVGAISDMSTDWGMNRWTEAWTEGLGGSSGWKALHGSTVCTTAQKANHMVDCIQREAASPSTLPLWNPAWSTASRSEVLRQRKRCICLSRSRWGLWKWSNGQRTSPIKTGQVRLVRPGEEAGPGRVLCSLLIHRGS